MIMNNNITETVATNLSKYKKTVINSIIRYITYIYDWYFNKDIYCIAYIYKNFVIVLRLRKSILYCFDIQ